MIGETDVIAGIGVDDGVAVSAASKGHRHVIDGDAGDIVLDVNDHMIVGLAIQAARTDGYPTVKNW